MSEDYQAIANVLAEAADLVIEVLQAEVPQIRRADIAAEILMLARTFEPDRDPTYAEIKAFRRFERLYGRALDLELTLPMLSSWYAPDLRNGVQDGV